VRYWLATLVGISLAAAAVAVVAWCTRALVERSLCGPASEQLACTAAPGALGAALAVCALVAIPLASAIFARRTRPAGTPLGALALGLAVSAAGGAALAAAIPSDDTTVQVTGYIVGAVLLAIGPLMLIGGIATTGSSRGAPARPAAATAASTSGAVFLSPGDARVRAAEAAARARSGDIAAQGFGQLAAMLSQVAEEARRASERGRGAGG